MKEINLEVSRLMREALFATPKECYANAMTGLHCYSESYPTLRYVEGYALAANMIFDKSVIPLQHAWLETDTEIFDPTWDNGIIYVPVYTVDQEQAHSLFDEQGVVTMPLCETDVVTKAVRKKWNSVDPYIECIKLYDELRNQ